MGTTLTILSSGDPGLQLDEVDAEAILEQYARGEILLVEAVSEIRRAVREATIKALRATPPDMADPTMSLESDSTRQLLESYARGETLCGDLVHSLREIVRSAQTTLGPRGGSPAGEQDDSVLLEEAQAPGFSRRLVEAELLGGDNRYRAYWDGHRFAIVEWALQMPDYCARFSDDPWVGARVRLVVSGVCFGAWDGIRHVWVHEDGYLYYPALLGLAEMFELVVQRAARSDR